MVRAQLEGVWRRRDWIEAEDPLTAAMFGTLKNLPPEVVVDLMRTVEPLEGSMRPELGHDLIWDFWPSWLTCEPDVVVWSSACVCVVEAKLFAGFGKGNDKDFQLAREWKDGLARAEGRDLWLIAITNHPSRSLAEASIREQLKGSDVNLARVCWISWRTALAQIRRNDEARLSGWIGDLTTLFDRMNLRPFEGFDDLLTEGTSNVSTWRDLLEDDSTVLDSSGMEALAAALRLHRRFMDRAYELVVKAISEMDQLGWRLWKNDGSAMVVRDGRAEGLSSKPRERDWVSSSVGVFFSRELQNDSSSLVSSGSTELAAVQVRWWYEDTIDVPHFLAAKLVVSAWPQWKDLRTLSKRLREGEVKIDLPGISYSGQCQRVSLTDLSSDTLGQMLRAITDPIV